MSQKENKKKVYTLEFKQSSAKLAVESDQPTSQTAKNLGLNALHPFDWTELSPK